MSHSELLHMAVRPPERAANRLRFRMRTVKLVFWSLCLLASLWIATINVSFLWTAFSVLASVIAFHRLIRCADGTFTGYLEMRNKDPESVNHTFQTLFNAAHKSIRVVTGAMYPPIYFAPEVFAAIEEAINRGVIIEIIIGEPDVTLESILSQVQDPAKVEKFRSWVEEDVDLGENRRTRRVTMRRAKARPSQHFTVIDGEHVRAEDPHYVLWGIPLGQHSHRAHTVFFAEDSKTWSRRFKSLADSSVDLEHLAA